MNTLGKFVQVAALPLLVSACSNEAPAPKAAHQASVEPSKSELNLSALETVDLLKEIDFKPEEAAEFISVRTNLATSLGMAIEAVEPGDDFHEGVRGVNSAMQSIRTACALLMGKSRISGTIDQPDTDECFEKVTGTDDVDCDLYDCK